jgi:TolB-like protein/DNA-binding winged helix-turn-helix (wHTH) protein/Tfp pilus assembly protein PilF
MDRLRKRYFLNGFALSPEEQLLTHDGQPVHLPKRPFQVLLYLVENRDRFVSRTELLDHFWDGKDVYDDALRKCVGAIRKALDDSENSRFIETRWGVGYRYIGPMRVEIVPRETTVTEIEKTRGVSIVYEEEEIHDVPAQATVIPQLSQSTLRSGRYAKLIAVATLALTLSVGAIIWTAWRRVRSTGPPPAIQSIAVLPLKNLSSDPETEYFSDGLTENLINTLARLEGLRVISRGSVFTFKGKEVDPRELRQKLGVGAVLEGSALTTGDRVRVDVRLVSTEDGHVLWASNTYDRPIGDIFTIQDEIARNAAAGLRLQLNREDQKRLARRYTDNPEAYQDTLRGLYFWSQRTPSGLRKAIESYQHATEKDPRCALAYAGLASSYALGVWYIPLEPKEAMSKAKAAATRAVELDPNLPEAHLVMQHVLGYEWDWAGARQEMERARELNPNFSDFGYAYTLLLSDQKPDEAVRWIKRSAELDPLSPLVSANVAQILYYARRYDEAMEQCRKTLELDPNYAMAHTHLGQAYIQKRMYREAIEELQKAISLSERNPEILAILGYAYAAAGDSKDADKVVAELTEASKRSYIPAFCVAEIYAELGRSDEAFAWLERAYNERAPHLVNLRVEPTLDSLRSDPRYGDLLRRVGLV